MTKYTLTKYNNMGQGRSHTLSALMAGKREDVIIILYEINTINKFKYISLKLKLSLNP